MKNFKRLAALVLALVLSLSLTVTAFAEEAANGTITINGASADAVYEVYKLLDLESYDATAEAYAYKVNSDWTSFFALADTQTYVTIDADGYVTWNKDNSSASAVETFAKKALAYAEANGIQPVQSSENEGQFVITSDETSSKGVFSNLELGYYLVDTSMGALCGLTTTNPSASINVKNGIPTIDKQVKEDSTEQWSTKNTADVGQTVEFRVTINVHDGAENYVLHDKMSSGLTFNKDSVTVTHVVPDVSTETADPSYYTVVTADEEELDEGCTFEVRFTDAFCDHLETNDKVIVTYSAVLNENAIIAQDGNPNETWLDYGDGHHTTHDQTQTYTYGFDIIKTNGQNKLIDGATFRIYTAAEGGDEVKVVAFEEGEGEDGEQRVKVYIRADETVTEGELIVVKNGAVRVVGLDNGTYYLEEVDAPDGYNKLTERHKFIISDGNHFATINDDVYSVNSGVQVVNNTGAMLPETGGVGTTLFYVIGGVLVAAAIVLLITRKRMSEN